MTNLTDEQRARRNANPTPEAVLATILLADDYVTFRSGPMNFWDILDISVKRKCELGAARILRAWKMHQPRRGVR